jgi:hypothetical protein
MTKLDWLSVLFAILGGSIGLSLVLGSWWLAAMLH